MKASLHALGLLTLLGACRDYEYRHEVSGVVVDAQNKPVADAVVRRVTEKGDQYGVNELYSRTTKADGAFSFVNEGRGPEHLAEAPWKVQVEYPVGSKHTFDVVAKWSDDRSGCFGYCARNVTIQLK
jgi:hypothetical protein